MTAVEREEKNPLRHHRRRRSVRRRAARDVRPRGGRRGRRQPFARIGWPSRRRIWSSCAAGSRPRAGPRKELVDRSVARRAAGDDAGTRPLLVDRVRLAQGRGEAECAAAVHDRDRRRDHSLHPRQVEARERAAADHDPWLARLGHRAARDRRPADRPDRARRHSRGRIPPGAAVLARLRLLERARRARLGFRPHRARVGGADEAPRLHALRRAGRRRGRARHRRDGPPGARRARRHPPQPARGGAVHRRPACRRNPSRNARHTRRSRRSRPTASATSRSR